MNNIDKEREQFISLLVKMYSTVNLSRKQAADALNISTATLDRMKANGTGPNYSKINTSSRSNNGKVFYPVTAIAEHLINNQKMCA